MDNAKKFLFRATYCTGNQPEKKLAIVAVDFTEALKKALEAAKQVNVGVEGGKYELVALKRGEIIDVE